MRRGTLTLLFFIILLAVGASFVVFWPQATGKAKPLYGINNPFTFVQGLDLQGGVEIQLQAKPGQKNVNLQQLQTTSQLIGQRINTGLGVKDATIRLQTGLTGVDSDSIVVDLPQFSGDQQTALQTIIQAGKLEFWDTGSTGLADNTAFSPSNYTQYNPNGAQFTGADLNPNSLAPSQDPTSGQYSINFSMNSAHAQAFGQFTSQHIGDYLTVTLDDNVITSAQIQSAITGNGQITGNFTLQQAQNIVNLLKSGALPITLQETSSQTIGGTLGADAISKSLLAGIIGLGIVVLFMLLYYRLPGLLADIALVLYSLMTLAIFKMIGVTMSLAGIAGFILSIGMAVDANVLIFERVKEELRAGRLMGSAIDIGWKRAWPSIRDSNTSTMITCAVLYFFGSNFGATMIVGFATTLFLGVVVSMFTAIVVTRTFLNLLVPTGFINHPALFGLPADAIPASSLARRNSSV
jgi:preprotein translocase subunit SecD